MIRMMVKVLEVMVVVLGEKNVEADGKRDKKKNERKKKRRKK